MGDSLRKNVQFQLLWFGGAVSQLGTQLTTYALPLLIYAVTGSLFWAGVIVGTRAAALIIAQMPAGVWVDRWDAGRVLFVRGIARMAREFLSRPEDLAAIITRAATTPRRSSPASA